MVDAYVLRALELWATWRIRRHDGALGFPRKSAFVRETTVASFWTPEMDSKCYAIDAAVCELIDERKQVIIAFYAMGGTLEQKAKLCGISLRTFERRLEMARLDLANRI